MAELFDRCIDAHDEAQVWPYYDTQSQAIAAVLRTIAAEILEHHHRASAREIAQLLLMAADNGPTEPDEPKDEEPPETWASHPSLTVEQRNPTLR